MTPSRVRVGRGRRGDISSKRLKARSRDDRELSIAGSVAVPLPRSREESPVEALRSAAFVVPAVRPRQAHRSRRLAPIPRLQDLPSLSNCACVYGYGDVVHVPPRVKVRRTDGTHEIDEAGALEVPVAPQIRACGQKMFLTSSGLPMNSPRTERKRRWRQSRAVRPCWCRSSPVIAPPSLPHFAFKRPFAAAHDTIFSPGATRSGFNRPSPVGPFDEKYETPSRAACRGCVPIPP